MAEDAPVYTPPPTAAGSPQWAAEMIRNAYRTYLGRVPSADEIAAHTGRHDSVSIANAIHDIRTGPEAVAYARRPRSRRRRRWAMPHAAPCRKAATGVRITSGVGPKRDRFSGATHRERPASIPPAGAQVNGGRTASKTRSGGWPHAMTPGRLGPSMPCSLTQSFCASFPKPAKSAPTRLTSVMGARWMCGATMTTEAARVMRGPFRPWMHRVRHRPRHRRLARCRCRLGMRPIRCQARQARSRRRRPHRPRKVRRRLTVPAFLRTRIGHWSRHKP